MENFVKTENDTDGLEEEECHFYDLEDLSNHTSSEKDPLDLEDVKKEEIFIKEEVSLNDDGLSQERSGINPVSNSKQEEVIIEDEILLDESYRRNSNGNSANLDILRIENTHSSQNFEENNSQFIRNAYLIYSGDSNHSESNTAFYYLDNISALTSLNTYGKSSYGSDHPGFDGNTQQSLMGLRVKGKVHRCLECYKEFPDRSKLVLHVRAHTGEKPFKCSVCNKLFSQSVILKRHMSVHTGEKPFKCSICNNVFSQIRSRNVHMRIHTGEKPFKCSKCNKLFSQVSNLNRHMRLHSGEKPYKCFECNKFFSQVNNLERHMRVHNNEKPYKCPECNNMFSQISNLNTHMRKHTGVKPFKCSVCKMAFSQISNLNRHMKVHSHEKTV